MIIYDLDKLQESYADPANDKLYGPRYIPCFNLAGYIDVLDTESIVVMHDTHELAWGFALIFERVLMELGFHFRVIMTQNIFTFQVLDCNDNMKSVTIAGPNAPKFIPLTHALYYVDKDSVNNCYLDLARSGIPSVENDDQTLLIKA